MNEPSAPDNSLLRWQREVNPLLLRWQEDELNEAEKKVLNAFREGWKADDWQGEIAVPPEGSSSPEKPAEGHTAKDWQDAILRAGFLRDLFLGNYGNFDPRPIVISRSWIKGQLDLDNCESRLPLKFSRCIFSNGIALPNAVIPELQLSGCEVRRLPRSTVSLFAQQAKVSTNVFLNDGFQAGGEVNLAGACLGGALICSGDFGEGLNADYLETKVGVNLSNGFKSDGEVNIFDAKIGGRFICRGHFKKGLYAQNMKTSSDVLMNSVLGAGGQVLSFESNGVVNLAGAEIGGQLACAGGHFKEGLMAQGLKTSSDVFMNSVLDADGQMLAFESDGVVNLIGAEIGGQLICCGRFEKGLNAQGLKTSSDVFLKSVFGANGRVLAFNSNGVVKLTSAEIDGQLACTGGYFKEGLIAQNMKTSRDVFLNSALCADGQLLAFESDGVVILRGAEIGGQLACAGGYFKEGLAADGLRYQSIELDGNWEKGLIWLSKMREGAFHTYEQLMSVYRRMGHTNWARNVGFALEKKRSKEFKGFWQWLTWRPWYGILRWTIGYGYKPFRFVPWALGLVMTGFFLFSSGHYESVSKYAPACLENEWIPSEAEALESQSWRQDREPPPDYLPFNPLIYSLEATFPVLPLGQLEKWHPSNGFLLGVRWALTLIGTPLLAILALFGAGVLGPRWRSGDEGG